MQRFVLPAIAGLMMTATAAAAMQPQDLDINGDGFATLSEVRTVFPGFSSFDFRDVDLNSDRRLSANELRSPDTRNIVARYESRMAIVHGLSDIDTNGDRFASQAELTVVYGGLLDSEFRQIDVNRDGRVSAPELYAPRAQALVSRYEAPDRMLVTIMDVDTNDDYFVSFEEMMQSFPGLSRIDFDIIDTNGDNRVASNEYYAPEAQQIIDQN